MGLFQRILKGEETTMMRSVFLLTVVLGLTYGSPDTMKKIEDHLKTWNCDVACWGERNVVKHKQMETEMMEKCMLQPVNPLMVGQSQAVPKTLPLMAASGAMKQFHAIPLNYLPASTYSLGYAPFHSHLGKRDAGDLEEFMGNAAMFKDGVESKMSNLSCVLQSFGAIDADPLTRMMGPLARFMKFNMCKKMCTKHLCGAAQAARMVAKFHGDEMNFDASEFGVRDKYEKAMMVAMVMTESMDPVKDFINQVFH